jgi:hypothetical protein
LPLKVARSNNDEGDDDDDAVDFGNENSLSMGAAAPTSAVRQDISKGLETGDVVYFSCEGVQLLEAGESKSNSSSGNNGFLTGEGFSGEAIHNDEMHTLRRCTH